MNAGSVFQHTRRRPWSETHTATSPSIPSSIAAKTTKHLDKITFIEVCAMEGSTPQLPFEELDISIYQGSCCRMGNVTTNSVPFFNTDENSRVPWCFSVTI